MVFAKNFSIPTTPTSIGTEIIPTPFLFIELKITFKELFKFTVCSKVSKQLTLSYFPGEMPMFKSK